MRCLSGIRAVVRLDAAQDPLCARVQSVEVHVHRDGIDGAHPRDELGRYDLRTASVLGFVREDETVVAGVVHVTFVVMVVHPRGKPRAEGLDERQRHGRKRRFAGLRRKGDVEHDHASGKGVSLGQRARGQKREADGGQLVEFVHRADQE
jgi:hypothetical protein